MRRVSSARRFCMPMDNPRVPSDLFELAFLNKGTGSGECVCANPDQHRCYSLAMVVPLIAVLTKYEALVDRVKDMAEANGGRPVTKKDVKSYLDENVLDSLKKSAHPPAAFVQTHRECRMFLVYETITMIPFRQG